MFSVWNCAPCANFVFEILLKFHQRVPLDVFGLELCALCEFRFRNFIKISSEGTP